MATDTSASERGNKILFWASFFTLIAAGVGFSVRGTSVLAEWGRQFGFTQTELGAITGGGLTGFGVTIIVLSFIADRIGYGILMLLAFLFHLSSAIVTLSATFAFEKYGKEGAFYCLNIGMWLFALGNGTCEAVINPLTATMFPKNKTHWLNILHAGWPAGLILGAILGLVFEKIGGVSWEVQIGIFLVPTLIYGLMMVGRRFPQSEASAGGVSLGTSLLSLLSPILLILFLIHAMVGYVELGTDSWITNITNKILESPTNATILFIWTSGLMFVLRFFAGPIVHQISPLGLLFFSAVLGAAGLYLLGTVEGLVMCFVAATVYGLGKTFFWPTMLGVISERYPKGGAIALGISGGIGMIAAGLLGGPGIGYKQDFFAVEKIQITSKAAYERYTTGEPKTFLEFTGLFPKVAGLDNAKVGLLESEDKRKQMQTDLEILEKTKGTDANLTNLSNWWETVGKPNLKDDQPKIVEARLHGARQALIYTALVPATMAVLYLFLIIVFKLMGGYRQVHIEDGSPGH
jgi:MFS family permease